MTRALAISFALHILLLWPAPTPPTMAGHAAFLLSATLRSFDRPVESPSPAPPPRRMRPSSSPVSAPAHSPTSNRVEFAPAHSPAPIHAESAPSGSDASSVSSEDDPSSALAPVPVFFEATQAVAVPQPAPADGLNADGLRQFRLALAREARRFKRYPARAMEAGWSGTTEVRLTFSPDAAGSRAEVVRGSGYGVLDEAALEMLRQAAPAAPLPESLRGRAFAVNLPVVFDLPE